METAAVLTSFSLIVVSPLESAEAVACSQEVNDNWAAIGMNNRKVRSCPKERDVFTVIELVRK
jgi:hypothetical protein